jgi:trimeric autotransporter adhesin
MTSKKSPVSSFSSATANPSQQNQQASSGANSFSVSGSLSALNSSTTISTSGTPLSLSSSSSSPSSSPMAAANLSSTFSKTSSSSSSPLSSPSAVLSSGSGSIFLQKTLTQNPTLFPQQQNLPLIVDNEDSCLNESNLRSVNSSNSNDVNLSSVLNQQMASSQPSASSIKKERFKLKKILSTTSSSSAQSFNTTSSISMSPTYASKSSNNSFQFLFSRSQDLDENAMSTGSASFKEEKSPDNLKNQSSTDNRNEKKSKLNFLLQDNEKNISSKTLTSSSDANMLNDPKPKKRIQHQTASLNSSIASSSSHMVNNLIPISEQTATTVSNTKTNPTVTTTTTISSKATLFTSSLLFHRVSNPEGSGKKSKNNYKERIKSMNVRRKSSTINATSCFSTSYLNDKSCPLKESTSTKTKNKSIPSNQINEKLIAKAAKRGSIHYNLGLCDQNADSSGVYMGVGDDKFKKKLLKLQKRQLEFSTASSSLLSSGIDRRKKAIVVDNISLTSCEEELNKKRSNKISDEFGSLNNKLDEDEEDTDYEDDNNDESVQINRNSSIKRLSHAISSLVSF